MKSPANKASRRRLPVQRRARNTFDAVLDAVVRILKRQGVAAVTTNRIAEVAGVSIGSVYQYFPDKRAIFVALHERHVAAIDRLVEAQLLGHAASPLDAMLRAMIEAMVKRTKKTPSYMNSFTMRCHTRRTERATSRFACTAPSGSPSLPGRTN